MGVSSADIRKLVERALAPVARRVRLVVSRGVVRLVDDSLKLQRVQVSLLRGELADGVERFQQYGFTSHPQPGAEAIALALGGDRSHTVVIAVEDRRFRLSALEEGEVALYDDQGSRVHLKRDGVIEISAGEVHLGAGATAGVGRVGDQVEVEIPPGSVVVAVSGGSGAPAVGASNPNPIKLVGEIVSGSQTIKAVD